MTPFFLRRIFNHLSEAGPDICCKINGTALSYEQFSHRVACIQNKIHAISDPVIGVSTENNPDTYAAIIACWLSGKAFVPVPLQYPAERLQTICSEAGINIILHSGESQTDREYGVALNQAAVLMTADLLIPHLSYTEVPSDHTAYILFTSGTTGKPKGVPVSFGNLQAFTEGFEALGYQLGRKDRFLQMFELTFDLSVMCYAIPLIYGASFYTLPSGMIKTLGLYDILESERITFSLMVPSAIQLLAPYFKDIELPDLRYSQFCGEALKTDILTQWMHCIPNAITDNVYGPTEATIYCTSMRVPRSHAESVSTSGIVHIGKDMLHVHTGIFDGEKQVSEASIPGELCISGQQLTSGYLNNPGQNSRSFFMHQGTRYYRTGDLVQYNLNGDLVYLGRIDDQVKIQGYRIELAEIELAVKKLIPMHENVVVAVELPDGIWKLAVFLRASSVDEDHVLGALRSILPEYMVPHLIFTIESFPLNSNGKTDRKELREIALKRIQ